MYVWINIHPTLTVIMTTCTCQQFTTGIDLLLFDLVGEWIEHLKGGSDGSIQRQCSNMSIPRGVKGKS
jgi:hypothetical protein